MSGRQHRTRLVHGTQKTLPDVRSEINVTPLVDVCLVLLIIFMVVTPMLTRGMDVRLPKTHHHNEKRDSGEQPIVSLLRDGARVRPYFDREAMTDLDALKKRIEEELRRKPGQRIFVKADAELTFGNVYPALMKIHEAGSPGVELGTAENKDK